MWLECSERGGKDIHEAAGAVRHGKQVRFYFQYDVKPGDGGKQRDTT